MSRTIRARLARLEAGLGTRNIVVWCDTPEEMEETIAAMIAEGENPAGSACHVRALGMGQVHPWGT